MNSSPFPEHDEHDQDIIRLLSELRGFDPAYPPELLSARRADFLSHAQRLQGVEIDEGLSPEEEKIVHLLEHIRSAQAEYPADLLASRRSAFLKQMERAAAPSLLDQIRSAVQRIFPSRAARPEAVRLSLVIASLLAAVLLGSLFLNDPELSFQPSPSQLAAAPTEAIPTDTETSVLIVCAPDEETSACPPGDLDPSEDLADSGNGNAQPAVSNDGVYPAAYVNDGRGGDSWVSSSPDSWLKIDLGKVTTINTIRLQKGSSDSSADSAPGQFVIAVALSDMYADGDSNNDYQEYAQVFRSEQANFSGSVSSAKTIRAQFPPVEARFVKITFEKAGTAIEEVGVFLVQPPVLAGQPTRTTQDTPPGVTSTAAAVSTGATLNTATFVPESTALPTSTAVAIRTTSTVSPSQTPLPSNTPTPLPTNTVSPTDTSIPVPTDPPPSDTPLPPPTVIPPTAVPPTDPPVGTEPIVVTGNNQTLTFTCNGNSAEVRGHANTVTLLGSCSSITVTGNSNQVFWQYGSPVITNRGRDNIIRQL